MKPVIINTPNGLKASPVLNRLAQALDTHLSKLDLKYHFEVGFDAAWELIIVPKNNQFDSGIVFKEHPNKKFHCVVFYYTHGFSEGAQHRFCNTIHNRDLERQLGQFSLDNLKRIAGEVVID